MLLPNIAIPYAVEVTVLIPVAPPPARTFTRVPVPTKACRVALTPASHSASHPVGSGTGGGKNVKPVKVSVPVSVINAILQILMRSVIIPAGFTKFKIVSSVITNGLPVAEPPLSKLTVICEDGYVVIICSKIFLI